MDNLTEENQNLKYKLGGNTGTSKEQFMVDDPTITMEGRQISNPMAVSLGQLDGKTYTMGKKIVGVFSLHF